MPRKGRRSGGRGPQYFIHKAAAVADPDESDTDQQDSDDAGDTESVASEVSQASSSSRPRQPQNNPPPQKEAKQGREQNQPPPKAPNTDNQSGLQWSDVQIMLDHQKTLVRQVLPVTENAEERQTMKDRLEAAGLKLFKSYIISSSQDEIISAGFAADDLEKKVAEAATDQEALNLVNEFQQKAKAAEKEFEKSLTEEVIKRHPKYKIYRKQLDEVYEEVHTIIHEQEQEKLSQGPGKNANKQNSSEFITTIDPVTKLRLINPIKNQLCNHIYGKASIMEIIAKNKKARCPYAGCANIHYLRKDQLVVDEEISKKIAEKIEEENGKDSGSSVRQSLQSSRQSVHLDESQ